MRAPLLVALLVLVALPCRAGDNPTADLTRIVKEALASEEPATAVLRGFASLPDFDMDGSAVAESLAASGAGAYSQAAEGQIAQVLGGVTRLTKKGDRVTIARRDAVKLPIAVGGKTKGWVQLEKAGGFRVRSTNGAITLDKFDGVSVGEKEDSLYALSSIGWKPGSPDSTLSITARWTLFSRTMTYQVPNTLPPPPAPKPSETRGMLSKLGAGDR